MGAKEDPIEPSPEQWMAESRWLRRLALRLVGNAAHAEDLVQDTWLTALRRRPAACGAPREWLAAVVRRMSHTRRRAEARRTERERATYADVSPPRPDELFQRAEAQKLLAEAVMRLEEPYRSTVILRYTEDLTPAEIARRRGLSASTVRSHLKRALAKLREDLESRSANDAREWTLALAPLIPRGRSAAGESLFRGGSLAMGKWIVSVSVLVLVAAGWWTWESGSEPSLHGMAPAADVERRERARELAVEQAVRDRAVPALPVPAQDEPPAAEPGIWSLVGNVEGPPSGDPLPLELELRSAYRQTEPRLRWTAMPGEPVLRDLGELFDSDEPRPEVLILDVGHPNFLPARVTLEPDRDERRRGIVERRPVEFAFDVSLRSATCIATGRIVDANGAPLAEKRPWVALVPFDERGAVAGAPTDRCVCDGDGRYRLRADRDGPYGVVAYLPPRERDARPFRPAFELFDTGGRAEVELPTLRVDRGVAIAGTLELGASTQAEGTTVEARWLRENTVPAVEGLAWDGSRFANSAVQVRVGEGGRFTLAGLERAEYELTARLGVSTVHLPREHRWTQARISAPAAGVLLGAEVVIARVRVTCRGREVFGSELAFRREGGAGWTTVARDSAEHRFALVEGEAHSVTIRHPDHATRTVELSTSVLDGEGVLEVELGDLPDQGRLVLRLAGDPLRQLEYGKLVLRRTDESPGPFAHTDRRVRRGDQLVFDGLPPGSWSATFTPSGSSGEARQATYFVPESFDVEILPGREARHTVELSEGGRLVVSRNLLEEDGPHAYTLIDPGGSALDVAMLGRVREDGARFTLTEWTVDSERDWEAEPILIPGAYRFRTRSPSGVEQQFEFEIEAGRTTRLER